MAGFELGSSSIGSDRGVHCATTTTAFFFFICPSFDLLWATHSPFQSNLYLASFKNVACIDTVSNLSILESSSE